MRSRIRWQAHLGAVSLLSMGLAAGCSSGRGSSLATRPAQAKAIDTIAQSSLREEALRFMAEASLSEDPRIRANAMEAAGLAVDRNAEVLRRGLSDSSAAVRSVACMTVGEKRATVFANDVRPLLQDSSPFVRCSAIYAMHRFGERVDRRDLARTLLDDPSTRARSHSAYILGELGERSAAPMLRQAVRLKPARASHIEINLFQLQVAEALVKLGDESQLEPLRAALYPSRPEDLEATALAVQILGSVQDKRSIDQLIYLSATRDEAGQRMPAEVRLAVASSLAKMGLRQGDFIADEFVKDDAPALRSQAAFVYGETGTPANLGVLVHLLSDPDWGVRVAAAASVVKIANAVPIAEPRIGQRSATGQ
jgi:HEAT repeat protein